VSLLVTGEAVALDLRTASLPSRLLAGLLDGLAQFTALFLLSIGVAIVGSDASGAAGDALGVGLFVMVFLGYPIGFETLLRGRTPGKAALGLRVVRDDGGPIGFRQALARGLSGAFLEKPGLTFFLAAIISIPVSSRGKRIGDMLAGTVVVQERVATRGGQVAHMPPPLAGWAAGLDLAGLPDDLALSVRQFLSRASDLTPQAREDLGGRLAGAVAAVTSPPPPPGTPGWAYLSAVLAERRRRDQARVDAATAARGAGRPAGGAWSGSGSGSPWPGVVPAAPVRAAGAVRPPAAPAAPNEPAVPPTPGPGGFVAPG
jgi:uncharacterized RDD family membrane protein YckC